MPQFHETRILPYTSRQLFDLVADVEKYPLFLPWCAAAKVNWSRENVINADVSVGYKFLRETFNSNVSLTPHTRIDVSYQRGPFRYLHNYWKFTSHKRGRAPQCEIEFFIDFDFSSKLLNATIGMVFTEAVRSMIHAFEQRARTVYGTSTLPATNRRKADR